MEREKTDNRYSILACPNCGGYKSNKSHTYGSYKVYVNKTILKLKCKGCGYTQTFRYIDGGI